MEQTFIIAITGLVAGIGSVIVSILTARSSAHKADLDAMSETIKTLQEENRRLAARLRDLEMERTSNRERIELLEEQVQALEEQVRKLGADPITETSKKWKKKPNA